MTRSLSTVMTSSLGLEGGPALVALIELAFGGGTVRLATAPVDILWNGFTWVGIGGQLQWEPARETAGDERSQSLRLQLSGVDPTLLASILQQQYIGRGIRVWYAHVAMGTNLSENSGFETDILGVVATGATLTRSQAVPAFAGDYVLAVAMTVSAADQGVLAFDRKGGNWLPVVAGQEYTFGLMAQMGAGSGARGLKADLDFYTATSGTYLGSAPTTTINLGPGAGWTPYLVTGTAPATATVCRGRFRSVAATGLYTVYVDGVRLYPGAREQVYQPTDGTAIQGGTVLTTPIQIFGGFMNGGFELEESFDFEQLSCTIDCRVTSRLAALTNRRGIKTNLEAHGRYFLGDQFFQHVPAISGQRLLWGNIAAWAQRFRNQGGISGFSGFRPRRP